MITDRQGRSLSRWTLLGLLGTLGVRAIVGGGQFLLAPSGSWIGASTDVLTPTPVDTFLLPGLFLFVALGVVPLTVAYGLYRDRRWAWRGSLVVAIVLAGWAIGEGVVLGWGERLQYLNLIQAIVMAALAAAAIAREYPELSEPSEASEPRDPSDR